MKKTKTRTAAVILLTLQKSKLKTTLTRIIGELSCKDVKKRLQHEDNKRILASQTVMDAKFLSGLSQIRLTDFAITVLRSSEPLTAKCRESKARALSSK